MYAIYGNIYHQYTPNVSIYTIHGSYGYTWTPFEPPFDVWCVAELSPGRQDAEFLLQLDPPIEYICVSFVQKGQDLQEGTPRDTDRAAMNPLRIH